ncbi:MAG: AbrB/MazE/SpoVT family DNA-binding domain-containing protein [Candidatus Woesearchaeota archaeon]
MKCPICKGNLIKSKTKEYYFGEYMGEYPAEVCDKCGETFLDSKAMQKIESKAKAKGIWGLGFSTKITKTGNSLAIRIPKKIAKYLTIREGTSVYIHPEKDRLVIDK